MRFSLRVLSALAFAAVVTSVAHGESFTFQVTGSVAASGIITAQADPSKAGVFDITSITGTYNGKAISLLPCATYSASNPCANPVQKTKFPESFSFDNLLYYTPGATGTPYLDFSGIGFSVGKGMNESSFFYNDGTNTDYDPGYNFFDNTNQYGSIDFTVSEVPAATPEPGSLVLMGTGLFGIIGSIRRRYRS